MGRSNYLVTRSIRIDERRYGVIECQAVHDRMERRHGHSGWHNVPEKVKTAAAVILPFCISLAVLYAHAALALALF